MVTSSYYGPEGPELATGCAICRDRATWIQKGTPCCQACFEFYYCERCEHVRQDTHHVDDDGRVLCDECWQ
jgi:hypothetical protein